MSDDGSGATQEGDGVRAAERRVAEAELKLTRLMQRLHALRRAAAVGFFDQVELDRTSAACRAADLEVRQARADWAQARANRGAAQTSPPSPPRSWTADAHAAPHAGHATNLPSAPPEAAPPPFEPTPYMRFMKWLVQSGRVSDGDQGDPSGE